MRHQKALQLELMHSLGIKYPKAHVVNHPSQLVAAAEGFAFSRRREGEYRRERRGHHQISNP